MYRYWQSSFEKFDLDKLRLFLLEVGYLSGNQSISQKRLWLIFDDSYDFTPLKSVNAVLKSDDFHIDRIYDNAQHFRTLCNACLV